MRGTRPRDARSPVHRWRGAAGRRAAPAGAQQQPVRRRTHAATASTARADAAAGWCESRRSRIPSRPRRRGRATPRRWPSRAHAASRRTRPRRPACPRGVHPSGACGTRRHRQRSTALRRGADPVGGSRPARARWLAGRARGTRACGTRPSATACSLTTARSTAPQGGGTARSEAPAPAAQTRRPQRTAPGAGRRTRTRWRIRRPRRAHAARGAPRHVAVARCLRRVARVPFASCAAHQAAAGSAMGSIGSGSSGPAASRVPLDSPWTQNAGLRSTSA